MRTFSYSINLLNVICILRNTLRQEKKLLFHSFYGTFKFPFSASFLVFVPANFRKYRKTERF